MWRGPEGPLANYTAVLQLHRMNSVPPYDPATAQVDQSHEKLLWTGAAANGALILALVAFAGGADDQSAALRMITLPAVLGVAGFSFGGTAIMYGAARLAQRLHEANAYAKIALAHQQMAAFKDVFESPSVDPEVARLVWGDQADDEVRKMLVGRLANAKASTDKSGATYEEGLAELQACAKAGSSRLQTAQRWLGASFATAAVGVVVLLGQAWATERNPAISEATVQAFEAKAPPAVMAPEDLPPCRSGAKECKPWERDWPEPPAVGTVVPGPRSDDR